MGARNLSLLNYHLGMRRGLGALITALMVLLATGVPAEGAAVPPSITDQSASAVSTGDATLEAQIDPGAAAGGAYYQFQISEFPTEFPDELACPPPPSSGPFVPCIGPESEGALPIGHIPAGDSPASVALDLAGAGVELKPGTTYYFRVVAASAVQGEDTIEWETPAAGGGVRTFTTMPCAVMPSFGLPADAGGSQVASSENRTHRRRHHRRHRSGTRGLGISAARIAF
jgi:hypothetical protein